MDFLNLSQGSSAILALIVVVVMLVLFVRETLPTEVVALAGTAVMLALGILPYDDAQAVLQNSAP
ncbi:MAG: SLC13 family permease, partial [Sulfitobacter sp. SK025]